MASWSNRLFRWTELALTDHFAEFFRAANKTKRVEVEYVLKSEDSQQDAVTQ